MKIVSIAEAVNTSTDSFTTTAVTLLQLKDLFDTKLLSLEEQREISILIWKCDLVHIVIEILRQDFTLVHGQWYTAVVLARLLANICSLLTPNKCASSSEDRASELTSEPTGEEVEEYYDILLPTATDSLLILANNIHEFEQDLSSSAYIDQLQTIMDSLLWLCSTHMLCTIRAIQSPYLLHLLVSENYIYSMSVLNTLQQLVEQHKEAIEHCNSDSVLSLLDEIVFKIGGSDKEQARTSIKLLVVFASAQTSCFETICSRYKGLSFLIQRWADISLDSSTHQFIRALLQNIALSDKNYEMNKAACIIQASWKGYCTRLKLKKMERGIKRFQQLYRQRKADKKNQMNATASQRSLILTQETMKQRSLRKHHEKQVAIIEQLPASSVSNYIAKQRKEAAVKIQSWWRGNRDRENLKKDALNREKSAIVIQRAYRNRLLVRGKMKPFPEHHNKLPKKKLQMEFNSSHSMERAQEGKEDVGALLHWFYESRAEQREIDKKMFSLLSQVHVLILVIT